MRILHTSDWHLGISAEQAPREEEHKLFLDWLIEQLEVRQIDVLVHAGDAFHYMQPAARSQRLYYDFLARCATLPALRQIVITGGNHDSPSRLDAPRDVLQALRVHVVGGMGSDEDTWERCLCPIMAPNSTDVEAVMVAVPYVHESRLGVITTGLSAQSIKLDMEERFRTMYARLADLAQVHYPNIPLVATGHLTCYPELRGHIEDGSYHTPLHMIEALGSLSPTIFDLRYSYIALGHIHRMFDIPGPNAWYAGSPVATDVIEARTPRYVLEIEVDPNRPEAHAEVTRVEIPRWRDVFELTGTRDALFSQLESLSWSGPLAPYLYLDLESDTPTHDGMNRVEALLERFERRTRPRVVRFRELLTSTPEADLLQAELLRAAPLAELSPAEVFSKMFAFKHGQPPGDDILAAFTSLLVDEEDAG